MSSKEFWEDDPQLYWSYRTFYLKQKEIEGTEINRIGWLIGSYTYTAVSIALNNAFSKQKRNYPKSPFGEDLELNKSEFQKELEKEKDINIRVQKEFNYWARL